MGRVAHARRSGNVNEATIYITTGTLNT
jgi:hypothetical protein